MSRIGFVEVGGRTVDYAGKICPKLQAMAEKFAQEGWPKDKSHITWWGCSESGCKSGLMKQGQKRDVAYIFGGGPDCAAFAEAVQAGLGVLERNGSLLTIQIAVDIATENLKKSLIAEEQLKRENEKTDEEYEKRWGFSRKEVLGH